MNRDETTKVLKTAKGLWPKYYASKDKAFHMQMIDDWSDNFDRAPYDHVINALYQIYERQTVKVHPTKKEVENAILDKYGNVRYSFASERPKPEDCERLKRSYARIGLEWPESE